MAESITRREGFDLRRFVAVWKPDNGTHRHPTGEMLHQRFHVARRHAERGHACALRRLGKGENLALCCLRIKIGVVNGTNDLLNLRSHHIFSSRSTIILLTTPGLAWPLVAFIT